MNSVTDLTLKKGEPLYRQIKQLIAHKIQSGDWMAGDRIPTEYALVEELNASRMTINRALRELTQEGLLVRRQGSGTFVAPRKLETGLLEIRNIADEIAARGHVHHARMLTLETARPPEDIAAIMTGPEDGPLFHCVVLHSEGDVPVQLEDRYVNPELVPDFMTQDFTAETPSGFLIRTVPYSRADHRISADIATEEQVRLLSLNAGEPVLTLERHTYAGDAVITTVRLFHPGSRFTVGGAFTADR